MRKEIGKIKLQTISELGNDFDILREEAQNLENQAIGAIKGLNDITSLIAQLLPSSKEKTVEEFVEDLNKRLLTLKDRINISMIQRKAKKETIEEVVKKIEDKYKKVESLIDNPNIGNYPKKSDIKERKKEKIKDGINPVS